MRFGLSNRRGVSSLVLALRQKTWDSIRLEEHVQQLPGGLDVLVGPLGADSARALDVELARVQTRPVPPDVDLLADLGRLEQTTIGQRRILEDSDCALLVVRSDASGLAHARWAIDRLWESGHRRPDLVLFGEGPYSASEAAAALSVSVIDVIPHDPKGASMTSGGPGRPNALLRSPLIAAAKRIVSALFKAYAASPSDITDEGTSVDVGVEREAFNNQPVEARSR